MNQLYLNGDKENIIAEYRANQGLFSSRKSEIILYQDCFTILDMLLVTCLITEQERRGEILSLFLAVVNAFTSILLLVSLFRPG